MEPSCIHPTATTLDPRPTRAEPGPSNVSAATDTPAAAALLSAVLEGLPGPALIADRRGVIRHRNAQAATLLALHDHLASALTPLRPPPPFCGWEEELEAALRRGAPAVWHGAVPVPSSGVPGVWDVHAAAVDCIEAEAATYGGPPLVMVTLIDVSQRVELERQLAAQERLLSIGRLAARVAHELNNPLDGILRYLGLARKLSTGAAAGESAEVRTRLAGYLDEARSGLLRMATIVRELLEFARKTPHGGETLGVNEIVEEAIRAVAPRADDQGVLIAADFQHRDMPAVPAGRLLQVCLNLLKNALDAMPRGGRIMISVGRVGRQVVLRITDTGPGLPRDVDVFEPSYSTKASGQGTGLGLAICKDIVEHLGGSIEACNAEEGGAVFVVRLPFDAPGHGRPRHSPGPVPSGQPAGGRVGGSDQ